MNIDGSHIENLIAKRKAAEKAVEGMPDGPMKEKAFEIVLSRLLDEVGQPTTTSRQTRGKQARKRASDTSGATAPAKARGGGARLLLDELVDDGFFNTERSLPEIADALRNRGHIYKQSGLSPHLIRMTRDRVLQRDKAEREGQKKMYFYRRAN